MASENSMPEGGPAATSWQRLNLHPREAILTWCQEAAPNPWYPSVFSQNSGIPREQLDPFLDELRLGGLIQLTEWVQGRGQGYALTPAGLEVVRNPRVLEKLRTAGVQRKPTLEVIGRPRGQEDATIWNRGERIREIFLEPFVPVVTYTLIAINVMFFLAGLLIARENGEPLNTYIQRSTETALHQTGAVSAGEVLVGQWWRLLTSCFVHIGLLHLGVNMYALYGFGSLVERLFGHWRYLLLYVIAGFGGACIGVLFQYGCAGASGAICGLLAAFGVWTWLNRRHLPAELVASWMRNVLINGVLIIGISAIPGISWSGHLGGFAVGLVAAALLNINRFRTGWVRWAALLGVLLLPLIAYELLVQAPNFNETWKEFKARITEQERLKQ